MFFSLPAPTRVAVGNLDHLERLRRSNLENRIIIIIVGVQSGDARLMAGAGGVCRSVQFKSNQCILNKESMKPGN